MRPKTTAELVFLIGAAALLAACQPSQPADAVADGPAPVKLEANEPARKQTPAKPAQVKKTVAKPAGAAPSKDAPSKATTADAVHASAPVAESRTLTLRQDEAIVTTISGCLERDGGAFRLTDTDGQHAPKARSWKSGFIKKGSASIEVVDAANRLKLASHVGHHVSLTGTLVDREMRARSVQTGSGSCD